MGRARRLQGAVLGVMVAFLGGCHRALPPPERDIPSVRVFNAALSPKAGLVRRGEVRSGVRLKLGFKVPGLLSAVYVREGQRVVKGQLVAQLRDGDVRAFAEGAAVRQAAAAREFALADQLLHLGATPAQSEARAREDLQFAQASRAAAAQAVSLTRLVSPVEGTVYRRLSEPGESVSPGAPVLVIDDDRRVVRFGVAAEDLTDLRVGQVASVSTLEEVPSAVGQVEARIASISHAPDLQTGLFSVEAAFAELERSPRVGTLVEARLARTPASGAVQVPIDALVSRSGRNWVAVVQGPTSRLHFVEVEIGRFQGRLAVLQRGLVGGERIVAEGAEYFLDGDPVAVAPVVTKELSSRTIVP